MNAINLNEFIRRIPKAELHLHIEGTFEPELMFQIAQRNHIKLRYASVEELKAAYSFSNLQDFLDIYYQGAEVLLHEQDFYDLTYAYLLKAKEDNICHTEIFFDPQTHTQRGVSFAAVIGGISRALQDGFENLGISYKIIMCFLRHLSEASAFKTLEEVLPYKHLIVAVGLDSSELGHPPVKFKQVFERALAEGFLTVAHAGEEGPAEYVWEALDSLKVSRIDHGNKSLSDNKLIERLKETRMPLTVCPLSNLKLKNVENLSVHPVREMLKNELMVTINSDDPAYFGGYVNDNFIALASGVHLTKEEVYQMAKNSFEASFLSKDEKQKYLVEVDAFAKQNL